MISDKTTAKVIYDLWHNKWTTKVSAFCKSRQRRRRKIPRLQRQIQSHRQRERKLRRIQMRLGKFPPSHFSLLNSI